ncbi:MAG: hypothetical protein ACLU80_09265 [Dorea sp.]
MIKPEEKPGYFYCTFVLKVVYISMMVANWLSHWYLDDNFN